MKRRHLLAGAAALPVSALAPGVATAAPADPIVALFAERMAAEAELCMLMDAEAEESRIDAVMDRQAELGATIAETPAVSIAGLAALAKLALDYHGHGMHEDAPDFAEFEARTDQQILRNLLASAGRLA